MRKIITAFVLISILSLGTVTGQSLEKEVTCDVLLQTADETISACDRALQLQKEKAAFAAEAYENASRRAADLERQRDSLWRSPYLWLAIGVAGGALTAGFVLRR